MMKEITDKIFHLAECPLWNAAEHSLYWTDILNGEIWKYHEPSEKSSLVWKARMVTGGFAFRSNGGLVICSDKGIFTLPAEFKPGTKARLLKKAPFGPGERFNDVTTDPAGRLIAGTKSGAGRHGKLFSFDGKGDPIMLLTGLGISNGMAFSPDNHYFYHTDSMDCSITRYEYSPDTGLISNPVPFYRGEAASGFPDGITADSRGNIWVAFWGASCIRTFNPGGKMINEIPVPAIQPSSLMFGGPELNRLYITSACEGAFDLKTGCDKDGNFLGGKVYTIMTSVKGRAEWPVVF
jgi:sugar lactone lactonase YvrE